MNRRRSSAGRRIGRLAGVQGQTAKPAHLEFLIVHRGVFLPLSRMSFQFLQHSRLVSHLMQDRLPTNCCEHLEDPPATPSQPEA
jgi:hypothetical protein